MKNVVEHGSSSKAYRGCVLEYMWAIVLDVGSQFATNFKMPFVHRSNPRSSNAPRSEDEPAWHHSLHTQRTDLVFPGGEW
eukprot:203208-Rhodomonas_salina.3